MVVRDTTEQPRPRFFRLTYSNAGTDEDVKLFQARDGIAFNEVAAGLPELGYEYGTTIHFYPDDHRKLDEYPFFRPEDLLVMPTRPPLKDMSGFVPLRKKIRNSNNDLEEIIFKELEKFFKHLDRKHIHLTKHALGMIRKNPSDWERLELFENRGTGHDFCGSGIQRRFIPESRRRPTRGGAPSTVAFFVFLESLPGVRCKFLASFGMDGYSTLIWNRLVRRNHRDWLAKPGFVMAEMVFKKPIPSKPLSPEFVDDAGFVDVNILT